MEGERRREWEVRGRRQGKKGERKREEEGVVEERGRGGRGKTKKGVRCRVLYRLRIYECNAL